jgi:hypothetical protein
VHVGKISISVTGRRYHVRVLYVRTKANFLFFIRVCGRCMCYTRKGMLSDSYIFKSLGFVLFVVYFTCVLLPCYYSPLVTVLSLLCIFFYFWSFSFSCCFFICGSFRSFALEASLRWGKLAPISIREVPVQFSPGTPTILTKKF